MKPIAETPPAVTVWILPARGRALRLPAAIRIGGCRFRRWGDDLWLTQASGERMIVRGFYVCETPPDLRDDAGILLPGELARLLAGLCERRQAAIMAERCARRHRSA